MRTSLATYGDQEAMIAMMRQRQSEAHYSDLLTAQGECGEGVVYQCHREHTGLRIMAVRHDALSERQYEALGEFRLHQYTLCGYYDPAVIFAQEMRTDPALSALPSGATHIMVGTGDGRLLAYFFIQPATAARASGGPPASPIRAQPITPAHTSPRMGDEERPLFPSEYDTFSPAVYTSLPALRRLRVDRVVELARLLRNQTVNSPLGAYAAIEAIYTAVYLTIHSGGMIQALIGNVGRAARRLMAHLNHPLLYAPLVPVIVAEPEYYWIKDMNLMGGFWPFAASREDVCAAVRYYEELDAILSLEPVVIRTALIRFNERADKNLPRALTPEPGTCPILWTPDPMFGEREPARAPVHVPARPRVGTDN